MADATDDTDARFRALIEAEYGAEDTGTLSPAPPPVQAPTAAPTPRVIVPFNELPTPRSWAPPDEEDEPFVPPPVEPMGPLSTPAWVSLLLLGSALVVGVLSIARVTLPWWVPGAGLVSFVLGLGVAFSRLPGQRPPGSDDGAVV